MDEQDDELESTPESSPKEEKHSVFEGVYQHLPRIPLKYLDIFIGVCVAALALVLVFGTLKGNGLI